MLAPSRSDDRRSWFDAFSRAFDRAAAAGHASAGRGGPVLRGVGGLPPQCIYFDAASCDKRATQLGAYCSVNGNEVHVSAAIGHYCLLTSSLVSSCIYVDQAQLQP